MILPNGRFCLIYPPHVCYSQDERTFHRLVDGAWKSCHESEEGAVEYFVDVPPPLKPRDHHWLTLDVPMWDSQASHDAGEPPVRQVHIQIGHRRALRCKDLGEEIARLLVTHSERPHNGDLRDPRWHAASKVEDHLGLLKHPHVQALEVTPRE